MDKGKSHLNYVSYSLYGASEIYISGAINNAKRVQDFSGQWQSVFYVGNDISHETVLHLESLNAIVIRQKDDWHPNGMFWRFNVFLDFEFECAIVRDADSFISNREYLAIMEWVQSGKTLHIMRDHPYHNALIMGGMWGATKEINRYHVNWKSAENYSSEHGQDQLFLEKEVYSLLWKDSLTHDSFLMLPKSKYAFPVSRVATQYVGQAVHDCATEEQDFLSDKITYFENHLNAQRLLAMRFMFKLCFKNLNIAILKRRNLYLSERSRFQADNSSGE